MGSLMGMGGGGFSASASSSASASQGGDYYGGSPVTLEGINRSNVPPWLVVAALGLGVVGIYIVATR